MQIIEEHEALPVHEPLIVLYGPPGSGKTSVAFTSFNPTLLDFDQGANRAVGRKRTVRFGHWNEVMEFMADGGPLTQLSPGTLIVDTAGAMLDELVADFAVRQNGRNGKPGGGVSLQGFGAVKDIFAAFLRRCKAMNVLPVFICHAVEKQDGDNTRLRPKLTGGSYDILIGKADLVGYVEMKGGQAVINFNPTDRHVGKNCVEFPELKVPHYTSPEYPGFFQGIIDKTRERMAAMTDAQRDALEQVKQIQDKVLSATDFPALADIHDEIDLLPEVYKIQVRPAYAKQFAAVWKEVNIVPATTAALLTPLVAQASELDEYLRYPIRQALVAAANELGLVYSREAGRYIEKEAPTPVAEPEPQDEGPTLEDALAAQQPAASAAETPVVETPVAEVPNTADAVLRSAQKALSATAKRPAS